MFYWIGPFALHRHTDTTASVPIHSALMGGVMGYRVAPQDSSMPIPHSKSSASRLLMAFIIVSALYIVEVWASTTLLSKQALQVQVPARRPKSVDTVSANTIRTSTARASIHAEPNGSKSAELSPLLSDFESDGRPVIGALFQGGHRCDVTRTSGILAVHMPEDAAWSWGRRLCSAIRTFAPSDVCWVDSNARAADIEIRHVDCAREALMAVNASRSRPVVLFQHSLAFADASRQTFEKAWMRASLTVSFQELSRDARRAGFAFHSMPWGADLHRFVPPQQPASREYVLMLGDQPDAESLGEVLFAAAHAGLRVHHVGDPGNQLCAPCVGRTTASAPLLCKPLEQLGNRTPCAFHVNLGRISDAALVREMQGARYVPVLRKFEGFEMGGIEGLFCGARPIVYRLPIYERWYGRHALYISSGLSSQALFFELVDSFRQPLNPVTADELVTLHQAFAWQNLVPAMFARVRREVVVERYLGGNHS